MKRRLLTLGPDNEPHNSAGSMLVGGAASPWYTFPLRTSWR